MNNPEAEAAQETVKCHSIHDLVLVMEGAREHYQDGFITTEHYVQYVLGKILEHYKCPLHPALRSAPEKSH